MRQLQREHREWVDRKYPGQPSEMPALGCVEEAGELVHAVLKLRTVETWGEDSRHRVAELRAKLVDAVGDCGIYACSLCNANGWDFEVLWDAAVTDDRHCFPFEGAARLVGAAVEVVTHHDEPEKLIVYLSYLKYAAHSLGIDAETAVRATWLVVKER